MNDFPLAVRWQADLPSFCLAWTAPVPDGDQVAARCGESVTGFGADDGEVRWRAELGARTGDGTFLLPAGDRYVTDIVRRPERLTSLVAVNRDGAPAWRADLSGRVTRGGAIVHGGEVLVLGRETGQMLYRLDAATGESHGRNPLPWAATALVPLGDGLLIAGAGLYRTAFDGSDPHPVAGGPVQRLAVSGDSLLTLSGGTVRVYDPKTLTVRWSAPARDEVAVLAGDTVLAVADDGPHGVLVARDASTGFERWRSAPLPGPAGRLAAAGPLVLVGHVAGNAFYRTADGTLIGETNRSYGDPAFADGRLYGGGQQVIWCAAAPA